MVAGWQLDGKLYFMRRGVTRACLNCCGNEPSDRDKLTMVVIG
jgi:hypothetical protein